MQVSKKLIIILTILLIVLLSLLLTLFLLLYKPQIITSLLFKGNYTNPLLKTENRTNNETQQIYNVKSMIKRNLVKIKEGINYHQAVILKVRQEENSTHAYLLTTDNMEWEFVKGTMEGGVTFKNPKRVLKCNQVYVLDFDITGMWIPQINRGIITDKGFITYINEKGLYKIEEFKNSCLGNGFVFNSSGEFSGICVGDRFIPSDEIYDMCPENCNQIYVMEVQNGNLQSENGLMVR
jgi:hypothetical protein